VNAEQVLLDWRLRNANKPPKRIRQKAMPRSAKMNEEQIRAVWTLYDAGHDLPAIASRIWERYEYKNERSCITTIRQAFMRNGWPTRTPLEAQRLRFATKRCAACEGPLDGWTKGCPSCAKRHHSRRQRNHPDAITPSCTVCGVSFDERTRGCGACNRRHWLRREKANAAA
jgi:hypothetical protein